MGKAPYYQIKSIVKAFRLMELLVTKNEFQLAELCRLLKSPKTTIHRMLLTLESLGYVQQNPQSLGYMASVKIFELGGKVAQNLNILQIAKPLMITLSEKTSETINLGILDGTDVICIDKVESKQRLKLDQPIGSRAKAYHTGIGKAILAYLSEGERARLFSKHTITLGTSKSLKTVSAIEKDLERGREQGYSVDNEEDIMGVACVGAPVFDHNSKVVAGLSIAGPALRINEGNIESMAKLVKETAALISKELGIPVEA
jgi:DNA-binding IclR family transcriptional regulator